MSNRFFKSFYYLILLYLIIAVLIIIFFTPAFSNKSNLNIIYEKTNISNMYSKENSITMNLNSEFLWPTPGYTLITSPFGRRFSPTYGASSFHEGIDIGAPARY